MLTVALVALASDDRCQCRRCVLSVPEVSTDMWPEWHADKLWPQARLGMLAYVQVCVSACLLSLSVVHLCADKREASVAHANHQKNIHGQIVQSAKQMLAVQSTHARMLVASDRVVTRDKVQKAERQRRCVNAGMAGETRLCILCTKVNY